MKKQLRKEKYTNVIVESELSIMVRVGLAVDLFSILGGEDINYTESGFDGFVYTTWIPVENTLN